jgi:hypothetical protein
MRTFGFAGRPNTLTNLRQILPGFTWLHLASSEVHPKCFPVPGLGNILN